MASYLDLIDRLTVGGPANPPTLGIGGSPDLPFHLGIGGPADVLNFHIGGQPDTGFGFGIGAAPDPMPFGSIGAYSNAPDPYIALKQKSAEAQKAAAARAGQPAVGGAANVGAQIVQQARTQFGEEGAKVVAAILQAEGGLGGATGDNTPGVPGYSPLGSHGPFQFHPGGQLAAFAQANNLSLEQAAQVARDRPLDAAAFALNGYLGQAIRGGLAQGHTGEALLRDALVAQNSGALQSPEHYARYRNALVNPPAFLAAQPTVPTDALMPNRGAATGAERVFPVVGYRGAVNLHWGSVRGGTDIFAEEGTPVVSVSAGTVTNVGRGGPGGNSVTIQGADGNQYYYAHLHGTPLVTQGDRVRAGAPIGGVGRTGNAATTPPHLHIGIGPSILNGTGAYGGTGGDYDAVALLQALLEH